MSTASPIAIDEPSPATARVCCILVNWNNAADTIACLDALALQDVDNLAVFVVDNASTDTSFAQIAVAIKGRDPNESIRMTLLQAGSNGGFSTGNNVGIRAAAQLQPEFFWLLNNDTVPPPDTLRKLLRAAEAAPAAGLIGSVLYYAHQPDQIQIWGGGSVRPSIARTAAFLTPHKFEKDDFLTFASVLLRADVVRQIGLLDERFFMYYEDVEYCLRAQRAGWQLAVAADTAILHKEGGSGGGDNLRLERVTTTSALTLIDVQGQSPLMGKHLYFWRRLAKRMLIFKWRNVEAVFVGGREFLQKKRRYRNWVADRLEG
jgi:GT2 family glycosyltransferase